MVLTYYSRQGGKNLLRKKIIQYFPNDIGFYVEPFFGAGNLFFEMEKLPCFSCEVVNDLDKDVYHLLKDIQKVTLDDVKKMDFKPSKKTFDYYKNNDNITDPVKRLNRNLYLNYRSFGGLNLTFAESKVGKNSTQTRKETLLKKLKCIQERLKGVIVLNEDYKKVIKDYGSRDTFFYLDPPYFETGVAGYKGATVDPEELYDAIKSLKGRFLLSYNDHPKVRQIFKEFHMKSIKTSYTINSDARSEVSELLISNYPLKAHKKPDAIKCKDA